MKLFHENPIFETVKSKVIISLFETVRLSVSISPRNLYNSLKSIKEMQKSPTLTKVYHITWISVIYENVTVSCLRVVKHRNFIG